MFKDNKYTKCYFQLIEKARGESRSKSDGIYYESHHIVPRCLGGNEVILLTAKEHYICHLLLTKMCVDGEHKLKMFHAFFYMKSVSESHERYIPSREFALLKEEFAKLLSKVKKGVPLNLSEEGRKRLIERAKSQRHTEESKDKIRKTHQGKSKSDEHRKKLSLAKEGKPMGPFSEDHKQKIGDAQRGIPREYSRGANNYNCKGPIQQIDHEGKVVEEFIGMRALTEAGFTKDVYYAISGRQKTHRGFYWRWKNENNV